MDIRLSKHVLLNVQFTTTNSKTGDMVQFYFLPMSWIVNGKVDVKEDGSVCFDCPFSKGNGCYVTKGHSMYGLISKVKRLHRLYLKGHQFSAGNYEQLIEACVDKPIRFGAYGEPVLLPIEIVSNITRVAKSWTGYTHRWKEPHIAPYMEYFMASCNDMNDLLLARALGYRSFLATRILPEVDGIINCPASKESGRKVVCSQCTLCQGNFRKAKDIFILQH